MLRLRPKVEKIELSKFITHVANEIRTARDQSKLQEDPVLELSGCEIEMALAVEGEAGAGIKVYVVELGGHLRSSNTSTVRLRFGAYGELVFDR